MSQTVKNLLTVWETWVGSLDWEDPLEKGMATHPRIIGASLVAQMVRTCLQCRRPRFDPWVIKMTWRRERQPLQLPGEFKGQRTLLSTDHGVAKNQTQLND